MDRARMKLGDKVTIPAVVEEIEHTILGEINYKVEPLSTWFDADEIEALGQTESEDCISRQQAVEAVTNTIRKKFSLADWYEQLVETGLEIENLIKELPPVTPTERTGWIPVSERLPEKNGYYIVSLNDAVDPCASFDNGKWYYVAFDCVSKEYREHEVIAWMPLPKPYKGGDDNA